KLFPEWRGNLFVGALAGQALHRLVLDGEQVIGEEELLSDLGERIRDVRQGSDGALWLLTGHPVGRVLRRAARWEDCRRAAPTSPSFRPQLPLSAHCYRLRPLEAPQLLLAVEGIEPRRNEDENAGERGAIGQLLPDGIADQNGPNDAGVAEGSDGGYLARAQRIDHAQVASEGEDRSKDEG